MSKQTAVEFFWEKVAEVLPIYVTHEEFVKIVNAKDQALQMEREQIEEAWDLSRRDIDYPADGNQYYKQTYTKKNHEKA